MAVENVPRTNAVTTRGMSIYIADNDSPIGYVQQFTLSQSRDIARIFEISANTDGNAIELVPGNLTDLTVTVRRVELYANILEEAFGFAGIGADGSTQNLAMLTDQTEPFKMEEVYQYVDSEGNVNSFGFVYHGCWVTSTGRDAPAEGNRLVTRDATIQCARMEFIRPYTIPGSTPA